MLEPRVDNTKSVSHISLILWLDFFTCHCGDANKIRFHQITEVLPGGRLLQGAGNHFPSQAEQPAQDQTGRLAFPGDMTAGELRSLAMTVNVMLRRISGASTAIYVFTKIFGKGWYLSGWYIAGSVVFVFTLVTAEPLSTILNVKSPYLTHQIDFECTCACAVSYGETRGSADKDRENPGSRGGVGK